MQKTKVTRKIGGKSKEMLASIETKKEKLFLRFYETDIAIACKYEIPLQDCIIAPSSDSSTVILTTPEERMSIKFHVPSIAPVFLKCVQQQSLAHKDMNVMSSLDDQMLACHPYPKFSLY